MGWGLQCNAIQYNTIQYHTMQCNAMQCNAMQCNAIQYDTIKYNTIHICSASCLFSCFSVDTLEMLKYFPGVSNNDDRNKNRNKTEKPVHYTKDVSRKWVRTTKLSKKWQAVSFGSKDYPSAQRKL